MDNRERIIRLWFDMWLTKKDLGISDIFSNNAIYIESWGPEYHGIKKIILWFEEWNTRGTVLQWDIKQFFHKDNQTIVEWYFKNKMDDGNVEAFDGIAITFSRLFSNRLIAWNSLLHYNYGRRC